MDHLQKIVTRQKLIDYVRQFFVDNNFQEFTIPVLNRSLPLESNIYSFSTNWQASSDNLYLTVSPESQLKRLLASGAGNSFAIAHCFRDLEASGPTHQPEFLMLEFYRRLSNYIDIMAVIENLCNNIFLRLGNNKDNRTNPVLIYQNRQFNLTSPWPKISMQQLFLDYAHLDLTQNLDLPSLQNTAHQKGYSINDSDTWESIFDQIFLNEIETHLTSFSQPIFITDYPSQISPLCQPHFDNPDFCQRFELYFGNLEIANGCTENTDTALIQKHFDKEAEHRLTNHLPTHLIDQDFIAASAQLTGFAGAGLGLDRLCMLATDSDSINQVTISPL